MNKKDLEFKIKEAKTAEESQNYFTSAIFYKDALEVAIQEQDGNAIKFCKQKLVQMNKKSIESGKDFKEVEFTNTFSADQQKRLRKLLINILETNDKKKVLEIIGVHPAFILHKKEIQVQADKTIPLTYQLASLTTISEDGHTIAGSSNGSYAWFMEMYKIYQEVIMNMALSRVMFVLMNKNPYSKELTYSELEDYFSTSQLFDPRRLQIVLVGLRKYYEKDYISAMHLLVPQFESFFLDVAEKCGINIIALDTRKKDLATRTKILSVDHLDSKEFIDIFGEDFCQQIKFILFEPMGYKFRHKIAHGEIHSKECNFQNTTLIIYLYLVVLARTQHAKGDKPDSG